MKFSFKKQNGTSAHAMLGNIDWSLITEFLTHTKEGADMEMVIRKKISWDISKMRKFFEGPVLDHIQKCYVDCKKTYGKPLIRSFMKAMFIGYDTKHIGYLGWQATHSQYLATTNIDAFAQFQNMQAETNVFASLISTTTLNFEDWKAFLTCIKGWLFDELHAELPVADNADIE